ncbi:MAG: SufS family cysteine desulfurase [Paludibacteraceae bacterium]|nr:SufS family cysteine desulfurase [Paludibacteraceae bacterium]
MLNISDIQSQFPILHERIHGQRLAYLDNAATTQKPLRVIERISNAYLHDNSNVHRGVHTLSLRSTEQFETARQTVAEFIGADERNEVVFTRGTTESVNLVASTYGEQNVGEGDEVIVTLAEHHSNFVPWQQLCLRKKAILRIVPLHPDCTLDMEAYENMLSEKTKIVAVAHASNVTGIVNPIDEIIRLAHNVGAKVLIDAAQTVPHIKLNVKHLDCDFLAFSGHKVYAPTGIGALYGKRHLLEQMRPYQFGGEMIKKVKTHETTFNEIPYRFEAGTPDYVGAMALAEALDFVSETGISDIAEHEHQLTQYAIRELNNIDGMRIIGSDTAQRTSVISFVIDGVHPYDLGMLIDQLGIAVRTGHHCAEPLIDSLGLTGTIRASFAVYNNIDDIDQLIAAIKKVLPMLR